LQELGHAIRYGFLRDNEARAVESVNRCFDLRPDDMVARFLEATLGTHLINRTAFIYLTANRRHRLLRAASARCLERGLSGYQAGAFLVGSLVEPESPVGFWEQFESAEIAFLLNEWVLHQKYLRLLDDVGESRISRVRSYILSQGLGALSIPRSEAAGFLTLKLSRADLDDVRRCIPEGSDPQTLELIDVLRQPFGMLFDYSDPMSLNRLRSVCTREGMPVPVSDES
jgi:hypothetical protein